MNMKRLAGNGRIDQAVSFSERPLNLRACSQDMSWAEGDEMPFQLKSAVKEHKTAEFNRNTSLTKTDTVSCDVVGDVIAVS